MVLYGISIMRLAKRGIQNEVMGEVFLQDQGGVGGFLSKSFFF
jgi:hypothetical protein